MSFFDTASAKSEIRSRPSGGSADDFVVSLQLPSAMSVPRRGTRRRCGDVFMAESDGVFALGVGPSNVPPLGELDQGGRTQRMRGPMDGDHAGP